MERGILDLVAKATRLLKVDLDHPTPFVRYLKKSGDVQRVG